MSKWKRLHDIDDEPALQSLRGNWVRSSRDADSLGDEPVRAGPGATLNVEIDHTSAIGDEPALLGVSLDADRAPGFAQIYRRRRSETSEAQRWMAITAAAVLSGPFAIGAALVSNSSATWYFVTAICVFGPLIEEMLKVGGILYLVEQRPWLVPSRTAVILTGATSGLVFSILENFWYLQILIDDPPGSLIMWRWSVCTLLHAGCSTIAALGVARIWITSHRTGQLPRIAIGSPYLIIAVVVHGTYNFASLLGETFFGFLDQQ